MRLLTPAVADEISIIIINDDYYVYKRRLQPRIR